MEKAEALADSLDENTNWRSTADKFRSLFQQWQEHQRNNIRIDKEDADALWARFSAARTKFNFARRKWVQSRDEERNSAKAAKEAIIAEAEALQDSTAWVETSRKFTELMDRWKKAGRAGRRDDDAMWERFRAAADAFFNARQADRDQISSSEKENLAKKEALLVKAEALVPVKDEESAKQARQALAAIQEEWDQIGYVPRDEVRRIEGRLAPSTSKSRLSRMPRGSSPIRKPTPASPPSRSSSTHSSPSLTRRSQPNPIRRRKPSLNPRRPPRSSG